MKLKKKKGSKDSYAYVSIFATQKYIKFRILSSLFDWLTHLYITTFKWYWRSLAFVEVFTLKFLFIIIYWRKRTPLCSRCARFPRFVQWPSEAAIDMYQLYTPEFQLYKRCVSRIGMARCRLFAALSATINTSIYVFGIALAVYIQYLIFTA